MKRNRFLLAATLAITSGAPAIAIEAHPGGVSDTIFANGFENYTLTVQNFLGWCSISIAGGVSSTAANPPPIDFPSGTVVPLSGAPASGFIWGYWTGTDVAGHDTNTDTTVTMTADRSVFVCCPFPDGSGCPANRSPR